MKKLLVIVISLFLIFGTNNYKELNSLAIITNIGIEKNNDKIKIIFQEIIPERKENKIEKTYKYYTNDSNNLNNAFSRLGDDITKEIYLEHLENIIIRTDDLDIVYDLEKYLSSNLDNFNIILSESEVDKVIKYSNNYKYVNALVNDNTTFRSIKKAKLEKKKIRVPVVKFIDNRLAFYKYKKIGDHNG